MTGPAEALSGDAAEVAPRLLGWVLRHRTPDGVVEAVLTEVEAYHGSADPASHAHRGPTPRNQVMFGPAGHLYVYLSYGTHWCANVVTGPDGQASAVLLRSARIVTGVPVARQRRGPRPAESALARGPGCLGRALGLTGELTGAYLLGDGDLTLAPGEPISAQRVRSGPRVGVSKAADVPWRFWIEGEPSVSGYRRAGRAPRPDQRLAQGPEEGRPEGE